MCLCGQTLGERSGGGLGWDKTKERRRANGPDPVVDLQPLIDVGQMKIDRPLGDYHPVGGFLAGVALGDQSQDLDLGWG